MTPEQIAAIKARADKALEADKAITGAHISHIKGATSIEVAKAVVTLKAAVQQDIPNLIAALEAAERERGALARDVAGYADKIIEYYRARITDIEAERDALKEDRDSIIRGAMLLEQKLKLELSDAVAKVAKYEMEAFKEMQHQAEAAKLRKSIPILPRRALEAKP